MIEHRTIHNNHAPPPPPPNRVSSIRERQKVLYCRILSIFSKLEASIDLTFELLSEVVVDDISSVRSMLFGEVFEKSGKISDKFYLFEF